MAFQISVGIVLVTLAALSCARRPMPLPSDCNDTYYGNCDLGPECDNWNPATTDSRCLDCCDGGFFPWSDYCDGIKNCRNGYDERYCDSKYLTSSDSSCFHVKHYCTDHSQCCSDICYDGICWDEGCK